MEKEVAKSNTTNCIISFPALYFALLSKEYSSKLYVTVVMLDK